MCIEIFSPDLPIVIPYESEIVCHKKNNRTSTEFIFLIQNGGTVPLDTLNVVYPRRLFEKRGNEWKMIGFRDITGDLPGALRGFDRPQEGWLRLSQDDPNNPQYERPPLVGRYVPGDASFAGLPGINSDQVSLLRNLAYTCFQVQLQTPIEPHEARWFYWHVNTSNVGIPITTPIGTVVYNRLASPRDVHRTLYESLQAGVNLEHGRGGNPWLEKETQHLLDLTGLGVERHVDLQYFELVLKPGKPSKRVLLSWTSERDLRMRSGSPRMGSDPRLDPPPDEPLFEWKSGSLLESPWKGQGFALHVTMLCFGK